jgi:hypothetical protein
LLYTVEASEPYGRIGIPLMRKRRVIICDTDRDLLSTLSYIFTVRGEYEVLTYPEPSFCPIWADDSDCTSPCADIFIASLIVSKMDGITLFQVQPLRGCRIFIKNKALVSNGTFDDNTMEGIMESGCVLFEKSLDFNKIASWLNYCEKHINLSQPLIIKRKEIRYASDKPVEYSIRPNANSFKGLSINTSPSGLCLTTDILLRDEQKVTINPSAPNPFQASVRWSHALKNGSYIIGLQFM